MKKNLFFFFGNLPFLSASGNVSFLSGSQSNAEMSVHKIKRLLVTIIKRGKSARTTRKCSFLKKHKQTIIRSNCFFLRVNNYQVCN